MNECENKKCNVRHDGSFGSGRFCSKSCANARNHSAETRKKTSESLKKTIKNGERPQPYLSSEKIEEAIRKKKEKAIDKLLKKDFSTLKYDSLRKRIFYEQNGACNRCNLTEWFNTPLSLELEHKDGDTTNSSRNNLEMLCPNCHSLTETWRGKNKNKNNKNTVTDEQVVRAYLECGNIRQALLKVGLAAKGSNYRRIKRALTLWDVDYKT